MMLINKIIKLFFLILLTFMFVYAFPVYRPINADILSAFFIYILLIFNKYSFNNFFKLIKSKGFLYILFIYIIFLLLVISFTTFKEAYDFSMIKTLLNNIFSLFVCAALVSIIYSEYKVYEMSSFIVIILILQSIFIILMFILPDVRVIFQNHLLTTSQLERVLSYGGIRGVSLSGSIAFGIAVLMGSMGFILHYWFVTVAKNISSVYKIIIFIVTLIASLSTGRSSVLGFILGFYIYIFYYSSFTQIKAYMKYLLMGILILIALYTYLSSIPELDFILDKYIKYSFRPILNYLDSGSLTVSSVEKLNHMYFFPPNGNIFLGDGFYTADDGNYYMKTDAGYMRFLLFFGLLGSGIIYILFLIFIFYINTKFNDSKFKYFVYGFVLIFFIYHYKGDVIFWNVGLMKVFILMILFEYMKFLDIKNQRKLVHRRNYTREE